MAFLTEFDVDEVKRLEAAGAAKRVKRDWIEKGYAHQMSLYGAMSNAETGETRAARIEILSNIFYTGRDVLLLHEFFRVMKPLKKYTIWAYNQPTQEITLAGSYE